MQKEKECGIIDSGELNSLFNVIAVIRRVRHKGRALMRSVSVIYGRDSNFFCKGRTERMHE